MQKSRIIILLCLIYLSCQKVPVDDGQINFENYMALFDALVKVNDSLRIELRSMTKGSQKLIMDVHTNLGKITQKGTAFVFHAPEKPDTVQIFLLLCAEDSLVYEQMIRILVFKQIIFLKADDLTYESNEIISENWRNFLNFALTNKINVNLGLIGSSLIFGNPGYILYLKDIYRTGFFEFFNHGFDHTINEKMTSDDYFDEFRNSTLDYQIGHLMLAQKLAKDKVGVTIHTFGPPGNSFDSNTLNALRNFEDIKVWYLGDNNFEGLILDKKGYIEHPIFNPDLQNFIKGYDENSSYLLYQFHPAKWDESNLDIFKQMIQFLKDKGVTFMKAYDYYQYTYEKSYEILISIPLVEKE